MPIYEFGYRTITDKQLGRHTGWISIAMSGIRMNWKSKLARRLIIGSWAPLLYFGAIFFMVGKVTETGLVEESSSAMGMVVGLFGPAAAEQLATNPEALRTPIWTILFYWQLNVQIFATIFMLAIVGPGLISDDLRTKAFPLYFAKPLSRTGYILGKFLTAAFFVAMVSLFPALFLYILSILFSPGLSTISQTIPVLLRLLPVYATILLASGSLILVLSSLTWSRRYLGFAWVALWFLSELFSSLLGQVNAIEVQQEWEEQGAHFSQHSRRPPAWTESISLRKNFLTVGHHLMQIDSEVTHLQKLTEGGIGSLLEPSLPKKQTPGKSRIRKILEELRWQQSARNAFIILGILTFFSFFILGRRIRREEVGG